MSQRRDVLNAIRRDAGVQDILLRPLSALHLSPTPAEEEGFVDRSRLLGISGRGRRDQLELAQKYRLPEIPTPGGGCRLADKENARRYWPVLSRWPEPDTRAFRLSNLGRQFWARQDGRDYWLAIGRTSADNQALHTVLGKDDAKIHLADIPGPLAVACGGRTWPEEMLRAAAALMASYSGKAVRLGAPVGVRASWLGGAWQGRGAAPPARASGRNRPGNRRARNCVPSRKRACTASRRRGTRRENRRVPLYKMTFSG